MATLTAEQPQRILPAGKVSFEEFIEWCDEDTWAEWVDGEIVFMPSPVSIGHQDVGGFLYTLLNLYTQANDLGKVVLAPYVMRMAAISRGREPDVLFVRKDRLHLITRNYLNGPADLAVEIVSPESQERDREEKFAEYERAGVLEFWLIDPDQQTAEFHALAADGRYQRLPVDADGVFHSTVVQGFWLRVDWLWQIPPALDALRALQVV